MTPTGPPANGTTATTNGLENKSPADVLHAAAAALRAAKASTSWGGIGRTLRLPHATQLDHRHDHLPGPPNQD